MFQYVALAWTIGDLTQTQAAGRLASRLRDGRSQWSCVFEAPGVRVYYCGSTSEVLHLNGGVVLGTLFKGIPEVKRVTASEKPSFDDRASRRIVGTAGRELVDGGYWGSYVAVLHDEKQMSTWVLHGPASSVPCLHTSYERVQIFFSCIEDCIGLGLPRFSIDWEYIALRLITNVPTEQTGLQRVSQVREGECVEISQDRICKRTYWSTSEPARTNLIEDPEIAADTLRQTVKACIHAWAACHESILLKLSGGLDSSIVLASLKDCESRPQITCLTYYSRGPGSDEREYARMAIQHAGGCRHVERERDSRSCLRPLLSARRSAVPQGTFQYAQTSRWQAELVRQCEATAIFSGSGGDQIFHQNEARLSVTDFIRKRGIGPDLARIAYDAAQLEGWSIWRVLCWGLHKAMAPQHWDQFEEMARLRKCISTDLLCKIRERRTSAKAQRESAINVPTGALSDICPLFVPTENYYNPWRHTNADQIDPLMSQPIIELQLQIPVYTLLTGGQYRGLARRAFAADLPHAIAQRQGKGESRDHTMSVVRANLPFARELLLHGLLIQRNLLDSSKVDEALTDRPSGITRSTAEVCKYLSIEAWLHTWTESSGGVSGVVAHTESA